MTLGTAARAVRSVSSCGARPAGTKSSPIRLKWPTGIRADSAVLVEWRERLVCSKSRFVEQPKAQRTSHRRLSE